MGKIALREDVTDDVLTLELFPAGCRVINGPTTGRLVYIDRFRRYRGPHF